MKVFLSSTYLDLIEHRKAVVQALRTMGEEVEHMEIFGARNEEPTKASLEELDKCNVLVGVYTYRYGTVPKGTKTSVTEQEYLHAIEKKIPVLAFVVDESHPWPPKLMDKSLTKVNKFKSKASSNHTPAYFTTPDNLASQVVAAIGKHIKNNSNTSNSLKISISPVIDKMTSIRWGERNVDAVKYFIDHCDEIKGGDEDKLIETFKSWNLLIPSKDGLNFTIVGALLFGPNDRTPSSFFTDVQIDDRRFDHTILKNLYGRCLLSIIVDLESYLSELWQVEGEDPSIRDSTGRPKRLESYPRANSVLIYGTNRLDFEA